MKEATASKKTLNIIAKNPYGETIYAESLSKNLNSFNKVEDVGQYLREKMTWPDCVICEYDKSTQQLLLVHDAISKKGQINWNLMTGEISIEKAFDAVKNRSITIIGICFEEAPGFGCGPDTILNIIEFLKMVTWLFLAVYNYIFPFKTMSKKYRINESYIKDTILVRESWDKGFLSIDNFRYKNIIERSIMRKLGYRIINKKWVNNYPGRRFKFPNEIIKGE